MKKDLLSNHAVVHKTTQDILVYYNNYNLKRQGRKISSRLRDLRNYRNFVDYDSNRNHNFKFMAKQSKIFSKFIFDNLEEF